MIKLCAGIAQTGKPDDRCRAYTELGTDWKSEEIEAAGSDVLAQLARRNSEPLRRQVFEQLRVNQVNLTKVWLRRILGNARPVLHCGSAMSVAFDSEACEQLDLWRCVLGERMRGAEADGDNASVHVRSARRRCSAATQTREARLGRRLEQLVGRRRYAHSCGLALGRLVLGTIANGPDDASRNTHSDFCPHFTA